MATKQPNPTEMANEVKASKESANTQNALAAVMKQLRETNDTKKFEHKDAITLKKGLVTIMDSLRHDEKAVRKEALFALKQSKQQIEALEDGALSNKKHIIDGLDAVIKSSEQGSLALIGLSKEVESRIFKALPTTKSFLTAFLRNSNPIVQAGINLLGDMKGLYKLGTDEAKKGRDKELQAESDALAETITSGEEVKSAVEKSTKEISGGLLQLDGSQRESYAELQKHTKGIDLLRVVSQGQTRILSALLKTWDSKASDEVDNTELIESIDTLGEYVAGIKEGIISEGKKNNLDPELVKGMIEGIDKEVKSMAKTVMNGTREEQDVFIENLNSHLQSLVNPEKDTKQVDLLEKISGTLEEQVAIEKAQDARSAQDAQKEVSDKRKKLGKGLAPGAEKSTEKAGGLMGMLLGAGASLIPIFQTIVLGVKTFSTMVGKIGAYFGMAAEAAKPAVVAVEAGAKAVSGFAKIAGVLMGALKFLGKISLIITVVMAVVDFCMGFANAGDVLDKAKEAVTIWDKIAAGLGGIIGGFLEFFDTIGGWLGFTTGWSKGLTKTISKIIAKQFEFFNWLLSGAFIKDITEAVKILFAKLPELVNNMVDSAVKFFEENFATFFTADFWKDKLTKGLDYIKSIPGKIFEMFDNIVKDYLKSIIPGMPDAMIPDVVKKYIGKEEPKPPVVSESNQRQEFPKSFKSRDKEIEDMMAAIDKPKASTVVNAPSSTTVNAGTTIHNNAPLATRNDDSKSFSDTMGYMAWGA